MKKRIAIPRDVGDILSGMGERIKLARLRRYYSLNQMAQWTGMSRHTLYKIEKGDSSVNIAAIAMVLKVLNLHEDLNAIAKDDVLGRKHFDANLKQRKRAPKQ